MWKMDKNLLHLKGLKRVRIYGRMGEVSLLAECSGSLIAPQPSKPNTLLEFPECAYLSMVQSHQLKVHTKRQFIYVDWKYNFLHAMFVNTRMDKMQDFFYKVSNDFVFSGLNVGYCHLYCRDTSRKFE